MPGYLEKMRQMGVQYGLREDGTPKDVGYLGMLKRLDGSGQRSSELSMGVNVDGKDMTIPSMVPGLSQAEIDHLLKTPMGPGMATPEITRKAVDHAMRRKALGLSPFYSRDEEVGY